MYICANFPYMKIDLFLSKALFLCEQSSLSAGQKQRCNCLFTLQNGLVKLSCSTRFGALGYVGTQLRQSFFFLFNFLFIYLFIYVVGCHNFQQHSCERKQTVLGVLG